MEWIVVIVCVLALCGALYFEWRWRKETKEVNITETVLVYRRKVRLIEAALMLVFAASAVYVLEYLTGEEVSGFQCLFLVGMLFGFSKTFFEPYYGVGVIPGIEDEVLYLRSFEADRHSILKKRSAYTKGFLMLPEKIEKTICKELRIKVGPVFAIGDPNSASPTTQEASSIYADDNDWQGAVAELARKAKVILLRIGDTDGCRWEMAHCIGNEYAQKMVFLVDSEVGLRILAKHAHAVLPDDVWNIDFTKSAIGLFLDHNGVWRYRKLPSLMAVRNFVACYLESYPETAKAHSKFKDIVKLKPKSPWWDWLSLLGNPIAYCLYNRWRTGMSIAMIAYFLVVTFFMPVAMLGIADDEDEYVVALILFGLPLLACSVLPWLWFAPKYTCSLNSWGGARLTYKEDACFVATCVRCCFNAFSCDILLVNKRIIDFIMLYYGKI